MNEKPTEEQTVKDVQDTTLNAEQTEKPEETVTEETPEITEESLGEILQDEPTDEPEKPTVDFKELYKKERKDKRKLESKLKEFESAIEDGASDDDIQSDIDDLADEFNVDKKFLKKLEKTIKANLEAEVEEKLSSKFKPLEAKEKAKEFETIITTRFNQALERMPDYKGIANIATILQLARLPENRSKTVSQLVEDTYSGAIGGRKSIETTTPRGGAAPTEVDFDLAKSDTSYFKQVMADPELKKKYNDGLARRLLR